MSDETRAQRGSGSYTSEAASQRASRLLPGPHSAGEQAAIAAALTGSSHANKLTKARVLVGAAVIAVAVTIPDLSAGAMDSPYMRIDVRQSNAMLDQVIWSPSAGATAPVYTSAMAAEEIAPASLTFANRPAFTSTDRMMPLSFLETGSERFDLAFAGVELPSPAAFTISRGRPEQGPADVAIRASALRTRFIDVPQIGDVRNLAPRMAPDVRAEGRPLASGSVVERSVAVANASVEAAFAGTLDVSGGVRDSLPISDRAPARPAPDQTARAVPVSSPTPAVSASAAAQAELITKTQLDARVNGVLTGSVDFQQMDGTIAIRLGSVIEILRDRYSSADLDRLLSSSAMGTYVTLAQLQATGVPISYNPVYDEVEFGIDYNDAPHAAKVQVEQIGTPSMGQDRTLIDQIPR